MARRPRKRSRWPIALAEVLLLQGVFAAGAHAAIAATATAGDNAAVTNPALTTDSFDSMSAIGGTDLYLDVTLNGSSSGLAHFAYRDGELWATATSLRQLGFALPAGTPDPVRLSSLRGMQVNFDQERQSVSIVAPLELLRIPVQVLNAQRTDAVKASASPGLALNYNFYGTQGQGGTSSLNAYTELRAFSGSGVLSTTTLSQMSRGSDGIWHDHSVRLDSSWSTSFPDSLLTLRVGDTLTAATSWSRPTRIGGIQIGTNFALQPYRVTTPLPEFLGSATLPSQVELYINGMRQYSGNVPAGQFQLNTVPSINGAGNAQMVLTDALGRVTSLDFSLYNTQQLLQKGLSDWSAELGVVREAYGLRSFEYGHDPLGSGTWRYGFSNSFTGEVHGEATNGLSNAGLGGSWLLDTAGVISGAVAGSQNRGLEGSQLSLGYNWTNSRFNFGVNGTQASSGYRDVASLYGSAPARLSANAQAGFSTAHLGSFGINYVHLRYEDQTSRYASAYWFRSIGRSTSLSFNVNQNLGVDRDRSFFLNFSMSLDDRTFLSAEMQHDGDRISSAITATHSIPSEGGFGWRAQLQQGDSTNGGQAELDYLGRYGQLQAGVSSLGPNSSVYANANGSLVMMGGHVFAARSIYDGFAVVSTDGIPGVPVKLENNVIGTTDAHGLLLVTPLNSYQNNLLSIDPMQLPADMKIDHVNVQAAPTDRAGTLVRFGIKPSRAAALTLVDAAGKPLPLGSQVRLRGQSGEPALVGFDGAVYMDTLDKINVLDVQTPAGACAVRFNYEKQGDGIPQIGPLVCREDTRP
jgi:outer membrane usher protein